MKSVTFTPGTKTLYTWISVRRSLFRKWWCVDVRNHCTGSEVNGLLDVCIAKFANKDDAEAYAKQQRKKRGY